MEVAKAALPFLHIGFDDIARIAHPFMPLVALGELFSHEGARIARDDLGIPARRRLVVEGPVAPDQARLDQRGADGQVVLCGAAHLVHRTRRLAYLQPAVPPGQALPPETGNTPDRTTD